MSGWTTSAPLPVGLFSVETVELAEFSLAMRRVRSHCILRGAKMKLLEPGTFGLAISSAYINRPLVGSWRISGFIRAAPQPWRALPLSSLFFLPGNFFYPSQPHTVQPSSHRSLLRKLPAPSHRTHISILQAQWLALLMVSALLSPLL